MADPIAAPVTRRELYSALGMIWLVLLIVLGDAANARRVWNNVALFVLAFLFVIYYAVKASRARAAE